MDSELCLDSIITWTVIPLEFERIKWWVKSRVNNSSRIAYAVGDAGINLYFIATMSFLLYFYTDIYGISAAAASGVFLVARQIDAFTDPLMGYICDRTVSRWGKFRPYILFGAIPLGLISIAVFTIPEFEELGKIIWAYVTYTLFGILYTVVTIPYAALTGVLTSEHDERATLSTFRMAGAFTGALVVSSFMLPTIAWFDNESIGFQMVMVIFSMGATILLWITFVGTKEQIDILEPETKVDFKDAWTAVTQNPPLWIVITLFILGMLAFTFRITSTPYYFKYVMGAQELMAPFLTTTLLVMYAGLLGIPHAVKKWGKSRTIQIGAVVAMIGALGFYFNSPENVVMVFVWGCVLAIGGAPIAVLGWAMIPNTVEYAQHRHRIRADGMIYSTATFFQKTGKTIAGASVPAILAITGFVANEAQSQQALNGILISMALIPFGVNVVLFVVSRFYKLDSEAHAEIVDELRKRMLEEQKSAESPLE